MGTVIPICTGEMATIFSLVFVLAEKTQTFKTRKKM
jgi:hypothetical protein